MGQSTLYRLSAPLVSLFVFASSWFKFCEDQRRAVLLSHWPLNADDAIDHLALIQDALAEKSDPELEQHGAKIFAVFLCDDPRVETPHRAELFARAGVFVSPGGTA